MPATFGFIDSNLVVESVFDPDHQNQLRLHTWDGGKARTALTVSHRGYTYTPTSIMGGLVEAVRFPVTSSPFGSAAKLTTSMLKFLSRYIRLAPEAAAILTAFALVSHFVDCFPIAPVIFLFGPSNETGLVLRLLGCLCRRPILLSDVDVKAFATLPNELCPSLLIHHHQLTRAVIRVLVASNDRHFRVARGNGQLHTHGAKAFLGNPGFVTGTGLRISVPPSLDQLSTLTDEDEKKMASLFQPKLLRYRMVNHQRIRHAQIDARAFVPAMRDQVRMWLAPLFECPELTKTVSNCLLQQSQEIKAAGLVDATCVVAETALFFCHQAGRKSFLVGELAKKANDLLTGRHEHVLTARKIGSILRALGFRGKRLTNGYTILLTDAVRGEIHRVANGYQVPPMQDGITRCPHCPGGKAARTT